MNFLSKLFSKSTQNKELKIYSPLNGKIINLENVPDVVFADKIVGDGVAIEPISDLVLSPIDGIIDNIYETNHAFSIKSNTGVEIFIHIGIDTVDLRGQGFTSLKNKGDHIIKGEPIIKLDLDFLKDKCKHITTPIVIANTNDNYHIEKFYLEEANNNDIIMNICIKS